jgi:signal peptidase II
LLVAAIVALDQVTKGWVVSYVPVGHYWFPIPALAHVVAVEHVTNTGVVFGLFKDAGPLFALTSTAIVIVMIVYLIRLPRDRLWARLALAFLLAGGIGNLIDRLRLGYVVDFIAVGSFSRFNVADSAVTIGVALMLATALLGGQRTPAVKAQAASDADSSHM